MSNPVLATIEFYGGEHPLWPEPLVATVTLLANPGNFGPVYIYDEQNNMGLLHPGQSVVLERLDISKLRVYGDFGNVSVIGRAG
jgi:hypothetical protein